jgi:predicted phage tail protein
LEPGLTELYQTLQKLVGFHRQLLDIVRLEREALLNVDLRSVQETTLAKEGLVQLIHQSETQRIKQVTLIAVQWKKQVKDLTLSKLIIEVQGKDLKFADQLRSMLNTLNLLTERIIEQNKENSRLAANALAHVDEMKKNILGEATPKSDTYSSQGKKMASTSGSHFISKEA